jgi:hypothetical protein
LALARQEGVEGEIEVVVGKEGRLLLRLVGLVRKKGVIEIGWGREDLRQDLAWVVKLRVN